MALAAALEDQANPQALYVVYMKLAEIHGNHLPDAQLCQVYRDQAQSLKKVLAGLGSSAAGEENVGDANTELGQKMKESLDDDPEFEDSLDERNLTFECIPDNKHCELNSTLRPLTIPMDLKVKSADMNLKEDIEQKCHMHFPSDTRSPYGSEPDTVASQSFRDSILTESFDTAKEHISDSSSSTDLYQNPTEGSDSKFDSEHSTPSQILLNHTRELTESADRRDTDSDAPDEENTPIEETEANAALIQQELDSVQEISQDEVCTETCVTCSDSTSITE